MRMQYTTYIVHVVHVQYIMYEYIHVVYMYMYVYVINLYVLLSIKGLCCDFDQENLRHWRQSCE